MRSDIGGGAWSYRRPKARTRRGTFAASVLTGLAVALLATYAQSSLEHTLVETKNLYAWLIWLGAAPARGEPGASSFRMRSGALPITPVALTRRLQAPWSQSRGTDPAALTRDMTFERAFRSAARDRGFLRTRLITS